MKRIALTGGIGSGKSVVAKIFAMLGGAVYDSDTHAKELMESDRELAESIRNEFGQDIYYNTNLDRKALAAKVFGNDTLLKKLNSLVHPAVMRNFEQWADGLTDTEFAVMESAVIIDNNLQHYFDAVITVSAPLTLRVQRAMQRDGATEKAVLARIAAQITDSEREKQADYVIINDEHHSLWEQALSIQLKIKNDLE